MRRRYWLLALVGIALLVGSVVFLLLRFEETLLPDPPAPQLVGVAVAATDTPLAALPIGTKPPRHTPATSANPITPPPALLTPAPTLLLPSPTPISHIVQAGEELLDIARRYGVTAAAIVALNNLGNMDHLIPGQPLTIPALPTPVQPTPTVTPNPAFAGAIRTAVDNPADVAAPAVTALPAGPLAVSGVPVDLFMPLSTEVRQHVREIYAQGQALGNNPRAFAKIGDSTIANPFFLAAFDTGPYTLGDYAYLQPVIDYFAGSYARESVAVRVGLHSWSVFDPQWSDPAVCAPGETVIACEFRLHRPSFVLIRLGSNDAGVPELFEDNMRQIIAVALDSGVIPILGTKADRHEDPNNANNDMLRRIAAEYQIPLWDFDLIAGTIPGRGLDVDQVHMTFFAAHDYTSPLAFQHGHSVHNLTALIVLDRVWRAALGFDSCGTAGGC